jgi:hypothetical protein
MIDQVPELNVEGFEALGVYDPGAPHAARRLELLQYLVGLGASADDLVARRDDCRASRPPRRSAAAGR